MCPTLALLEVTGADTGEHPSLIRGKTVFDSSPVTENSWELLMKTFEKLNAGCASPCNEPKTPSYVTVLEAEA